MLSSRNFFPTSRNPLELVCDPKVERLVSEILDTYVPSGRVLLVLPCSARKPYRQSPSQRLYWRAAVQAVSKPSILERATLSGIYGIVPASFEDRVLDYDFNLNRASFTMGKHREIVGLLANRVACFLKQYGNSFAAVVAFGRERYWEVMHLAARDLKADKLWVIPRNKGTSLRREGLDELQSVLKRLAE